MDSPGGPRQEHECLWLLRLRPDQVHTGPSHGTQRTQPRAASMLARTVETAEADRRGGDSNPRSACADTRFPSELLKPLGHLSAGVRRSTAPREAQRHTDRIARGQEQSRHPCSSGPDELKQKTRPGGHPPSRVSFGEGGIRTPGREDPTLVFETSPFSRSGTSP